MRHSTATDKTAPLDTRQLSGRSNMDNGLPWRRSKWREWSTGTALNWSVGNGEEILQPQIDPLRSTTGSELTLELRHLQWIDLVYTPLGQRDRWQASSRPCLSLQEFKNFFSQQPCGGYLNSTGWKYSLSILYRSNFHMSHMNIPGKILENRQSSPETSN